MTTPTDDEIVAHIVARATPNTSPIAISIMKAGARKALRLAREGLPVPVKDEAEALWEAVFANSKTVLTGDAVATIRKFLTERDAERDLDVAELVAAAYYALNWLKVINHKDKRTLDLSAALAKLERKP